MAKTKKSGGDAPSGDGTSLILKNRKAFHNYEVLETLECGMVLSGTEVKSLRDKHVVFADGYATVRNDELFMIGVNISEYAMGNRMNHTPDATRKLLAHKRQIKKLKQSSEAKGFTLVPLDLHWRRGIAKVTIGVVRGKGEFDKRHAIKDREVDMERRRALKR